MKKLICFTMFTLFMLTSISFAGSSVPTASGDDVIVPVSLIATISDDPANAQVFAIMHDAKGAGHKVSMTFNGTDFIAHGARGADFHPVIMDGDKPNWAKIEEVWSTDAAFVKWRRGGPCLHVE